MIMSLRGQIARLIAPAVLLLTFGLVRVDLTGTETQSEGGDGPDVVLIDAQGRTPPADR